MNRRAFVALTTAGILAKPSGQAQASTEVKHGPNPVFEKPVKRDETFSCDVVAYATSLPDWAAGGVTRYTFNSNNSAKRRAELLALRTCFLEWFREQYEANGGSRREAAGQVIGLAQGWLSLR
jgi:hypothetical protein